MQLMSGSTNLAQLRHGQPGNWGSAFIFFQFLLKQPNEICWIFYMAQANEPQKFEAVCIGKNERK